VTRADPIRDKARERMKRTGESYSTARMGVEKGLPEPPPRCICAKQTKRICPVHPNAGEV
jgi:hypothetical protein